MSAPRWAHRREGIFRQINRQYGGSKFDDGCPFAHSRADCLISVKPGILNSNRDPWTSLTLLWGLWYSAIFTFGGEESIQAIIWGGALIVGAATLPKFLKEFRWRHLPAEVQLLGIFWLWTFTGLLVAVDLDLFARYSRLVFQFLLILLMLSFDIARSGAIKPLLASFLAVGAGLTLYSAAELDTGISLESTKGLQRVVEANAVGFRALLGMMGGMALFTETRSKVLRGVIVLGMALSLYGLVLSASRGAFVLLFIFIAMWLATSSSTIVRSKLAYVAILIIVGVICYYFYEYVIAETNLGRRTLLAQQLEDNSTQFRIYLMLMAWDVFLDYPLFGAGLGQYGYATGTGYYAHVEISEILGTTGLIGLLIYYYMYLVTWQRLNWLHRHIQDPMVIDRINFARVSLLLMVIASLLFRINFISQDTMFLYAYIVGVSLWAKRMSKVVQPMGVQRPSPRLASAPGLLDKRP